MFPNGFPDYTGDDAGQLTFYKRHGDVIVFSKRGGTLEDGGSLSLAYVAACPIQYVSFIATASTPFSDTDRRVIVLFHGQIVGYAPISDEEVDETPPPGVYRTGEIFRAADGTQLASDKVAGFFAPASINLLIVERLTVSDGKLRVSHEEVRQAGNVVLNCYAARFINAGTTTVMVGRVPLENNEEYKIDGLPGTINDTAFAVVFDDGTTGTAITKKATGKQTANNTPAGD